MLSGPAVIAVCLQKCIAEIAGKHNHIEREKRSSHVPIKTINHKPTLRGRRRGQRDRIESPLWKED
jgi:hypothetical protein